MQIEIADKKITLNQNQVRAYKHLANLQKQIVKFSNQNPVKLAIKKLFDKKTIIKNIYIYGKVGRGKSMLMRHFFENLPIDDKVYFHFNSFMQEVHKELHILRQSNLEKSHLVKRATKKVIGKARLLCFDEMQVEDVADAMILQAVFNYFVENKIIVVLTSNCHPLDLYENGLQRDLFLEFVNKILLTNFLVLSLEGKTDYRSQFLSSKKHYFYPSNSKNKKEVLDIWLKITENESPAPKEIKVLGRSLIVRKAYKNIALFDFKELCRANLSVADYCAICKEFSLIFLLNVPILKAEDRNEAKRLIWFIDEAYEKKVQLVVLAECKPEEIYVKGVGAKAFKRAASRLNEITS
jgi:cell division protein ZapE